VQTAEEI
jgi:hypothetical protein